MLPEGLYSKYPNGYQTKQKTNRRTIIMTNSSKRSRKVATIITMILVAALLFTGTYAWQSISQQALNQAIGKAAPAGGRLHDDFEIMGENYGELSWRKDSEANKDIYVENFEDQDGRDIFVRLRLYEYMEIGQGANLHPGEAGFADRAAVSLIEGADREDYTTWAPRVPSADPASDLFREYWAWNQGGQKTYMPTFNKDPFSKESDVKGDAIDPQALQPGEVVNPTNPGGNNTYAPGAGLHDYYETNDSYESQVKYWNWNLNNGDGSHSVTTTNETHTARPTLDAQIVLMADWDGSIGSYWVLDVDGWAYWAAPLAPETTTGLLLNSITLIQVPKEEWYYGIFVDAEMATADEINPAFYGDPEKLPSNDAKDLLNTITGNLTPALMRQVTHTNEAGGVFMETGMNKDAVITFEVLDLNLNRYNSEAALVESFNADGGFRGVQLAGAKDLTHAESESKVYVFWDIDGNFYLAGRGGVHATGSLWAMFCRNHNMVSAELALLDTSRVTNMRTMFHGTSSLTSLDLSGFDTSNVTDMGIMFEYSTNLTIIEGLPNFDTSKVTNMARMFRGTSSLTTLDLSGFDTSKVTDMSEMFRDTGALTTLDLSSWDTSNVTTMRNMFTTAKSLTTLDLSGFDTSSVIDMTDMFWGMQNLQSINLSDWNTSNVIYMGGMFRNNISLQSLDLSSFDTSQVTHVDRLFDNTPVLATLDFRNANFGAVTESVLMFTNSGINTIIVRDQAARDFLAPLAPGATITIG